MGADEDVGEEEGVAAAVSAFGVVDGDLDGLLPMALNEEALADGAQSRAVPAGEAGVEGGVESFVGDEGAALDDVELSAALGAVDGDAVALPGAWALRE